MSDRNRNAQVFGRLAGLLMEIPPVAYVALTGRVPDWARVWICAWLVFWLVVTVCTATVAQSTDKSKAVRA